MTTRITNTKIVVVMKLLTKNTDYAVRALIMLAKSETIVSTCDISEKHGIPYPFLRRILQTLARNNIVRTKEGAGGGITLAINPVQITLKDVLNMFQGDIRLSDCMFRQKVCKNRMKCALRKKLLKVSHMVENEFGKLTIEELVKKTGG